MQIDNIVFVPLNQEGKFAIVDADDAWVCGYTWFLHSGGYAVRNRLRNEPPGSGQILMHREIALTPHGLQCDHRNRNKLDNRRLNLRDATMSQQRCNEKMKATNSTGFRGVFRNPSGGYRAQIQWRARHYHLGHFPTPEQAAHAYDKAAREMHGEFAHLNFPE